MNTLLNILYVGIGFIVGLFVYAQILLPLIYGLPKTVLLFAKKKVRFAAVVSQLTTPLLWFVFFLIAGFILQSISPNTVRFLVSNPALNAGGWLAIAALLLNFLTRKGRADMKSDFDRWIQKYYLVQSSERKQIDEILNHYSRNQSG